MAATHTILRSRRDSKSSYRFFLNTSESAYISSLPPSSIGRKELDSSLVPVLCARVSRIITFSLTISAWGIEAGARGLGQLVCYRSDSPRELSQEA